MRMRLPEHLDELIVHLSSSTGCAYRGLQIVPVYISLEHEL